MDRLQPAGNGPRARTILTGELIRASPHRLQGGISGSNLKHCRRVLMTGPTYTDHRLRRTAEKVGAGEGETN